MSHLIYYKDNILSKIQEIKDLEEMEDWMRQFCLDEQNVKLSIGFLSPKLKISKYALLNLIKERKNYNQTMIDKYLELSFKEKQEVKDEINEKSN